MTNFQKIALPIILVILSILIFYFYENIACYLFGDSLNYHGELIKLLLSCIGGIFIIYGLLLNARRTKALEIQNSINDKGAINERFKNGIDHLGSDKNSIILGGIHSLHRIAIEDKTFRSTIFDIFCSYIRENTKILNEIQTPEEFIPLNEPSIVIQTIIDLIFKSDLNNNYIYDNLSANLKGAKLDLIDLEEAHLKNANLRGTTFNQANLKGANLSGSLVIDTKFIKSRMSNCDFSDSKLVNPNFNEAKVDNALFVNVICELGDFSETDLSNGKFSKCSFKNLIFKNTKLNKSKMMGNYFYKVIFDNTKLRKAIFNTSEFEKCEFKSAKSYQSDYFNTIHNNGIFYSSSFENSKFSSSRISNCKIETSNFNNVNFDDAVIDNVDIMKNSIFDNCSLLRTKLNRSYFSDTSRINTSFDNCEKTDCFF